MATLSAGLLLFRRDGPELSVLLAHPGGPFWTKKDAGAWSIPKGEYLPGEDPLAAARREFHEELGSPAPDGPVLPLGEVKQPSRKVVTAFAVRGEFDPATVSSNLFELEWPPRSGRVQRFPEVDRADWFGLEEAAIRILAGQRPFLCRLRAALDAQ